MRASRSIAHQHQRSRATAFIIAWLPLLLLSFFFVKAHAANTSTELCLNLASYSSGQLQVSAQVNTQLKKISVFEASETLSQKIRDNAKDQFLQEVENHSPELKPFVRHIGWVKGDNHLGNYIALPVKGSDELQVRFVDIKDGGISPLILDLARLIVTTFAIGRDVPKKEITKIIFESYIAGLKGKPLKLPKSIADALAEMSKADYQRKLSKYVQKKVKVVEGQTRFKFSEGDLAPLSSESARAANAFASATAPNRMRFQSIQLRQDIQAAIRSLHKDATLLDVGVRPRDRGGGKDLLRFWALFQTLDSEPMLLEFKEIGEPAAALLAQQLDHVSRFANLERMEWDSEDLGYRQVKLAGEDFTMRPKKIDVLKVPYKLESDDDLDFIKDYASLAGHMTGLSHGKQAAGQDLLAQLTGLSDPEYATLSKKQKPDFEKQKIKEARQKLRAYAKRYLRDFQFRYGIAEEKGQDDKDGSDEEQGHDNE